MVYGGNFNRLYIKRLAKACGITTSLSANPMEAIDPRRAPKKEWHIINQRELMLNKIHLYNFLNI